MSQCLARRLEHSTLILKTIERGGGSHTAYHALWFCYFFEQTDYFRRRVVYTRSVLVVFCSFFFALSPSLFSHAIWMVTWLINPSDRILKSILCNASWSPDFQSVLLCQSDIFNYDLILFIPFRRKCLSLKRCFYNRFVLTRFSRPISFYARIIC